MLLFRFAVRGRISKASCCGVGLGIPTGSCRFCSQVERSLQGTQISGALFSRRACACGACVAHRAAYAPPIRLPNACRTPEICVPSFWQHHFTRRAEHARISPAPAALRHRRFERRHWQRRCPACCAALSCSESSTPTRAVERSLVLTGCAHRVQRSLRQRVSFLRVLHTDGSW